MGGPIAPLSMEGDHDHVERDHRLYLGRYHRTMKMAERKAAWPGARKTNYQSGALWKYAQLVGPPIWVRSRNRERKAETQ